MVQYNIPYANFQAGDDIEPTQFNSDFVYIENALNEMYGSRLLTTGGTMTGSIAMSNNKITGLGSGTATTDAVNKAQLDTKLSAVGGTCTGAIAMSSNKITGLANGTDPNDAANVSQIPALSQALLLAGGIMTGNIAMGTKKVTGLGDATVSGDAVHYGQFVANLSSSGYINFPGGLQIRYGAATGDSSGVITFSQPFSNSCLMVLNTPNNTLGTAMLSTHFYAQNLTKTTFKVPYGSMAYKYIAIGM